MFNVSILNTYIFLIIVFFLQVFFSAKNAFAQSKEYMEKYKKATELFNQSKDEDALNQLNLAIALEPAQYEALYSRAFYYFAKGEYQKAYNDYNALLPKYQNETEAVLGRANTAIALDDYAQAEEDFLTIYERDSTHAEAINGLGSVYFLTNMYADALYFLDKSIKLNAKDNEFAYFYRGSLFLEKKEYEKAMKDVETLLKKDAKDVDALRLKAKILFEQKKYTEVQKTLDLLVEDKKNKKQQTENNTENNLQEDDFVLWGRSFYIQKKYKEAEFYFNTPQKPRNPDLYYYKAKNYVMLNQLEKARLALDSAIIIQDQDNPVSAFYFYDRSFVYFKEKNNAKAQYDYLKSVYLMPEFGIKNPEIDDKMGEMYELLNMKSKQNLVDSCMVKGYQERAEVAIIENDDNEALAQLKNALKINNDNAYTHTLVANTYIISGKWDLAKESIKIAELAKTDRRFERITFLKGVVARETKNWTEAQTIFEKLAKEYPKNADYKSELGHIFYEQKNYAQALLYINKAIDQQPEEMDYYNDRALYAYHLQKYDDALVDCERVIKNDNQNILAYYHRGLIYKAQKRNADAKKDFQKVLSYLPEDTEVLQMLKSVE